ISGLGICSPEVREDCSSEHAKTFYKCPKAEKLMSGINRGFTYRFVVAAVALAALSVMGTALFSQDSQNAPATKPNPFTETIHALPPGGPPPRLPDGHIDFTGRYYPNKAGRMLDTATPGHMD